MIRILQQDSPLIKVLFALIIGAAVITMVITLVPGIFDNGTVTDAAVYATVREPGLLGRFTSNTPIKATEVNSLAQRQLQQQHLPDFLLSYMAQRAGQVLVQRAILKSEADRMGLQVSDEDLRRELQHGTFGQYLFPGGKFIGEDQYINFVQSAFQTSVADFEQQVKRTSS